MRSKRRSGEQRGGVPHRAVEYPPFAIAFYPGYPIVTVGADLPAAHVRFRGIDTDQYVQLLPREWAVRQEVVELIHVVESLAAERLGERTVRIVDLQRLRLHGMRPVRCANQVAIFGQV